MIHTMDRKAPSFSSSLLDEIYASIDERARLEKKIKNFSPLKNNALLFSSRSTSSDSNSSFFSEPNSTKPKPKPIRVNVEETERDGAPPSAKSRALKLYARLKKIKQPISPGAKFSSFIDSILQKKRAKPQTTTFPRSNVVIETEPIMCRASTRVDRERVRHQNDRMERNGALVKPGFKTTTFTGSEFVPYRVAETGMRRSLTRVDQERFRHQIHPTKQTGALVKPGLQKTTLSDFLTKHVGTGREGEVVNSRSLTRVDLEKLRHQVHPMEQNGSSVRPGPNARLRTPIDEDCGASDCSEDLFEIDHLKLCSGRDSGELPVYETTRVGSSNRCNRLV